MEISKIMLIFTIITLVFSGFYTISLPSAQIIGASTVPFSFSPPVNISANYNESMTQNGNVIKSGYIINYGNISQIFSVNYSGKIFEANVMPDQKWNFIEINGITAASDSSEISIDSSKSDFYHMNQWLKLTISGNCSGQKIYTYSKNPPSRIFGSSVSWEYDGEKSLIILDMKSCPGQEVIIDLSKYASYRGTIFVEDLTRYEELLTKISSLKNELETVAKKNMNIVSEINRIENSSLLLEHNISVEIEKKNSLAMGIEEIKKNITEANKTTENLTIKTKNSAILTPLQAILVFAILAALIIYIFLFFRKDFFAKERKVDENEI